MFDIIIVYVNIVISDNNTNIIFHQ